MMRFLGVLLFFGIPLIALAQVNIFTASQQPLATDTLLIGATPPYPAPGDTVTLSLQASGIDLDRAQITWLVNGKPLVGTANAKEASLVLGALGTETDVTVSAADGIRTADAHATLHPSTVTLLWTSDSYVPPTYRGRALPGSSANVVMYALAQLQTGKAPIPENNLIYTWYRDGTLLSNVSGRGKSSAEISGPLLFGSETIRVHVESLDGTVASEGSVVLPSSDTHLTLYENNPLFGVLYHRAIVGDVRASENEEKVSAVPYFAHIHTPLDGSLQYAWSVNDASIAPNPDEPQTLSIQTNNYSGPAHIELSLISTADIFMHAQGLWNLLFGAQGGVSSAPGTDPFGQ